MSHTLFIIGNGFSKSLYKHYALDIDPSEPFGFNIPSPFDPNKKLLEELPNLKQLLESRNTKPDFDLIKEFIDTYNYNSATNSMHLQHRQIAQYLALAYAYANKKIAEKFDVSWPWYKYFEKNKTSIYAIFTLNYSLEIELLLNKLDIKKHRLGTNENDQGDSIPIFKPHGSSDFDLPGINIPPRSRLNSIIQDNQYFV